VWPCNYEALEVFISSATQWRRIVRGNRVEFLGLDYPAVQSVMQMLEVSQPQQVFKDVRAMERAALEIFRNG